MNQKELFAFLRRKSLAVIATSDRDGKPEAALVGIAFDDKLNAIFDTSSHSRKFRNIIENPKVSLVVGWDDETTVQIDGIADGRTAEVPGDWKAAYFAVFPDGRERASWPNIAYVRVMPKWIRFSNYLGSEPEVHEFTFNLGRA